MYSVCVYARFLTKLKYPLYKLLKNIQIFKWNYYFVYSILSFLILLGLVMQIIQVVTFIEKVQVIFVHFGTKLNFLVKQEVNFYCSIYDLWGIFDRW